MQAMRIAAIAAMVLALIFVFVVLPRWQEGRQDRLRDSAGLKPSPNPRTPIQDAGRPLPPVESTPLEPSSPPTATNTPAPTPYRPPRENPQRQQSAAERQFVDAMSDGLAALEQRQWQAATDAFERASRLRPEAPEVTDGLARAKAGQRLETIADGLRRAQSLEQREAWREAESTYSAVLAIDPESAPALAGQRRTEARAALDEKLEYHIANPARLTNEDVFADASSALDEAMETLPSGPRLESQVGRLEALLEEASTPVPVVLESDALTEVVVYRFGRLGTFIRHEISLKPGTYTVVGSRNGFRDVRLQLVVNPGSPPEPLVVRCTEGL